MNEISVDGSNERTTVRGCRAEDEKTHALEFLAEFRRRESTFVGNDVAQMRTRVLRTRVEQSL